MGGPILKEYIEKAQAESNPAKLNTSIKILSVDSHRLRMKVIPLPLVDDSKQWWISEGDGKITTWEELVEGFFCKFYLESYDGEDEMLDEGDNWGIDPLEFISRVNSSFENNMRVDGRTKKEPDYGKPPNAITNSFFKPYLKPEEQNNTAKRNLLSQIKRKDNNMNDEQPSKRICKTEKFEAIKYSLGPNEEYIAIRRCEYNAWERNKDSVSQIFQEIFQKKDDGWKVTRTE
nr:hypothetical protein [Tanacetum cinerariifolium]